MDFTHIKITNFKHVKVGDIVTRMLAGVVPCKLKVTEVTDTLIISGTEECNWSFDRATGAEVDEDLGWGIRDANGVMSPTGSYLIIVQEPPCASK